jgi:hypothetical protein
MVRDGGISALNSARGSESPSGWSKGQPELVVPTGLLTSGRLDLNQRSPASEAGGHSRLAHVPIWHRASRGSGSYADFRGLCLTRGGNCKE